MTYTEYKELVKEYNSTDSVSRREKIKEEVYKTSVALAKQLEGMYNRFGATFIDDDEYSSDRGCFSLIRFDGEIVTLNYSDTWKYGGDCSFGVSVPMRMLDVGARSDEQHRLFEEQIARLEKEFEENSQTMVSLRVQNRKIVAEISRLKGSIKQ